MMWKSRREISQIIKGIQAPERLDRFFALSAFWDKAVYPPNYQAEAIWPSLLTPTEDGATYIENLSEIQGSTPPAEFYLALFTKFFHHQIIFDWQKSDLSSIEALLQNELSEEKIRLPYRFGRLLYDRFHEISPTVGTEQMLPEEAAELLEGTPQGVYQQSSLLCGPLGVLTSCEVRRIPPSRELPLWHCSDTGCRALHTVLLKPPPIPLIQAKKSVSEALEARLGPPSEWYSELAWLHRYPHRSVARKYIDLPLVIADCVIGPERTGLVEMALKGSQGNLLRTALARSSRHRKDSEGPPKEVAGRLSPEEQLQLLLILPDPELIHLLDEAVHRCTIPIGLGGVRHTKQSPPIMYEDTGSELSALGIRSTIGNPTINLVSTIWRAYSDKGLLDDLQWRLRGSSGVSAHDCLVAFIRNEGPYDAIRELILTSQSLTEFVCEELDICIDRTLTDKGYAINQMLWKLGFDPPEYDDFAERFHSRLSHFNETVLSVSPVQLEDHRERIRASGVNLFVSVEDFLDQLLVYNIWLLASDHFLETGFEFDLSQARRKVSEALGADLSSGDTSVSWNPEGENAMGVLFAYLSESLRWMEALGEDDREALIRPSEDIPHYATDPHRPFPFRHTAFWADADWNELQKYARSYRTVVKLLEQANLAFVRNGLDHKREDTRFPESDTMLACVARIREAFDLADINRLVPKTFWPHRMSVNRFGSIEYEFRDYMNRPLVLFGPPTVSGLRSVDIRKPYLIAPGNLLGKANSQVLFTPAETNDYTKYWKEYPRRRHIPPLSGDDEGNVLQ